MAYRKLGVTNKHRRSMLASLTKQLIINERIETTETRAKEVRKCFDKMVTYGKSGSLVSRRLALAFLHNDNDCVQKVFNELAPRYKDRNIRISIDKIYAFFLLSHFSAKKKTKYFDLLSIFFIISLTLVVHNIII